MPEQDGTGRMAESEGMNSLLHVLGKKEQKTQTFGDENLVIPAHDDDIEGIVVEAKPEPQAVPQDPEETQEIEQEPESTDEGPSFIEKTRGAISEGISKGKGAVQSGLKLHSQQSSEMSPPDDQQAALSSLPKAELDKINAIDPEFVDMMAKGPSSFIDQDAYALLQTMPKENQLKFWEMVLSPKEGFRQLAAEGKERTAKATIREVVAKLAQNYAESASQDAEDKMFKWTVDQLRKKTDIQLFCREMKIQVPEQGTFEESEVLLRSHYMWLAQAKRSNEIQKQIELIVAKKVKLQGELGVIKVETEMQPQIIQARIERDAANAKAVAAGLPALIDARAELYPLRQKAIAQRSAHIVGTGTSTVTAGVVGGILGIPAGAIVATEYVRGGFTAKMMEAKDWADNKIEEAKEKIAQAKEERVAKKVSQSRGR